MGAGSAVATIVITALLSGPTLSPAVADPSAASAAASPNGAPVDCGNGTWLVKPNPPSSFDALSATDDQLRQYGYPPRPTDPNDYATWHHFVTSPIDWGGPTCNQSAGVGGTRPNAAGGVSSSTFSSTNWTGYETTGATYLDAEANFKVPTGTTSTTSADSHWVGIGQGSSTTHPLVQAGSQSMSNAGTMTYNLWYEVYPQNPSEISVETAQPGDLVYIEIVFTTNRESERVVNQTRGFDHTYIQSYSASPDDTAEFISERPCNTSNNTLYRLLPYTTMIFTGADWSTGSGFKTLGTAANVNLISPMSEPGTGTQTAHTGAINQTTQNSFQTYFDNFGVSGKACP
jgi:hypothetical protein